MKATLTTIQAKTNFWLRMRRRYYERAGEAKDAKERLDWLARVAEADAELTATT